MWSAFRQSAIGILQLTILLEVLEIYYLIREKKCQKVCKMKFNTVAALLDGVHTDFTVSVFEDTIFIAITQNSKLGTLYLFKPELSSDDQGYDIIALFGREDDNITASVASLMRALKVDRRTIISVMLENTSFRTIRAIREVLTSLI